VDLIAFILFGVFVFRIRERFDTVDVGALDRFRGERGARAMLGCPPTPNALLEGLIAR
jgi:hypothetical protein